ncbi:uncharacterized protein BDCG_03057 [Blastomyces dermatitidis ER-3]|uniref:Uncharacterized protein n=1 Tax=Ajellomyces dermatitidis (strain ER-3 / ATCC MYA-2586) TaxID=559297 RepID=A0ABP2EVI0_AJEDR|nr:uncharacterized protein BDCG_03057 [Blastomyces dermatitidis ER-3]EEQ87937.2 hypothetical protein BDCG_03057 [Blastomyces dermatitidis ER-3]
MPENTKLYLQVSSDTLCEAPNRFDRANSTPLGRKVSNGLSRILAPGEKVCVIQLFDDDANALILLFRVLHHKIQAIPTKRTPSQLLDLAVVADKYCCEKPLFPFTGVWLQGHLEALEGDGMTFEKSLEILYFSYIMDLSTRSMSGKKPSGTFRTDDVPAEPSSSSEFAKHSAGLACGHLRSHHRNSASQRPAPNYLRFAYAEPQLPFPWQQGVRHAGFGATPGTCTYAAKRYWDNPRPVNGDFKSSLWLELHQLTAGMCGVCLDCVTSSGESATKGKCRLPH